MELATFRRISCILVALPRILIHIGFVLVEILLKGRQHFVLDAYDAYMQNFKLFGFIDN